MPLSWGGVTLRGGNLPRDEERPLREILDEFGDAIAEALDRLGLPHHLSVVFRPFDLLAVRDDSNLVAVFANARGGMLNQRWLTQPQPLSETDLAIAARDQLGWEIQLGVRLPLAAGDTRQRSIAAAANAHARKIEAANAIGRIRGVDSVPHLVPYLREFLTDHPDPDVNVFIMMRFRETEQMASIHRTMKDSLAGRGMSGLRADDKDYTGELWSNLQVYMTGCHLGIAVFEDIDDRDFNPNVSLELGYMLGISRRCLVLKEKRLPALPTDVANRLYKPFDAFRIAETIEAEIDRWVTVDLGLGQIQSLG